MGDTIMAVTVEHAKVQPDESAQVREEICGSIPIINEATREIDLDAENGI